MLTKSIRSLLLLSLLLSPLVQGATTGADIYKEVLETTSIYQDEELQAYIEKLGEEIVAQSEMAGEKFTFTLLDSPELNAFATRDNYVYVNRGLLNYVRNEAELVSVLAHEVGHITRDHVTGQEGQAAGAQILSAIAAVLSGSNEVYEAGMAYANSIIRGHGRRNELEADEAGAEYMAKLGYSPDEMISMLSLMKDYESLQKKRAAAKGAARQTYHGIFSTHPRNDSRLRTVVSKAEVFKAEVSRGNGAATYRRYTEGLVWGENFLAKEQKPERFSNMRLRVRFDFPKDWVQSQPTSPILARAESPETSASLSLQAMARTAQSPEEFLYNYLNVAQLRDGKTIAPARLKGFTGILPGTNGSADSRIALVYYKLNAYLFIGEVQQQADFAETDKLFLSAINSFRPISNREIQGQKPQTVHYVKATSATTFEGLAKALKLSSTDIDDLRIINGYYPSGEPKAGEWIKIFRR